MSKELKPCPFCGSNDLDKGHSGIASNVADYIYIRCKKCNCVLGSEFDDTKELIKAWNKRANQGITAFICNRKGDNKGDDKYERLLESNRRLLHLNKKLKENLYEFNKKDLIDIIPK